MVIRKAGINRKTTETNIRMKLNLDGSGSYRARTTVPFMDHMLSLFAQHGGFDLEVASTGDTQIDDHHLVEDLGICLGECIIKALGNKQGIRRYGDASVPMDETLVTAQVDISGRPFMVFHVKFTRSVKQGFDHGLIEDFFRAVAVHGKLTLHLNLAYGRDNHHIAEAAFKAFAVALRTAVTLRKRTKGIPSTKGRL